MLWRTDIRVLKEAVQKQVNHARSLQEAQNHQVNCCVRCATAWEALWQSLGSPVCLATVRETNAHGVPLDRISRHAQKTTVSGS